MTRYQGSAGQWLLKQCVHVCVYFGCMLLLYCFSLLGIGNLKENSNEWYDTFD